MTYDQLVTKIRAYTEVDSTVFTSIIVDGFIEDAEFRIMTDVDLDVFRSTLMQKDVSFIDEYTANRTTTGTPLFYAYWNETKLLLGPTPDVALNVECAYVKRPNTTDGTKLDSSNTTTYLSMNAPNTLLYACLVEAYSFLKDKDMLATYEGRYAQSLRGLGIEQQGRRRRDEYVDGEIRQKLRSVPPSP